MSNAVAKQDKKAISAPAEFRQRSTQIASTFLRDWVGEERAREATGRIATALSASAAAAKNPQDFYDCTPQSIAKVIAISALTGIMVSTGQGALAYAIPRRPRKGEPPQLQYQLSHRGIAALAKRADLSLVAYPISYADTVDVDESGEIVIRSRDIDNPPQTEEHLRGVMVLVRSIETGVVLSRGFVAKTIINTRREQSDSYLYAERNDWAKESSPWHKWYTEMAIKTAMHYAIGRGWCVIDDTEAIRALSVDAEGDYKQVQVTLEERSKSDLIADRLQSDTVEASDLPPNASKRLAEWWNAMASKSDEREVAALCDEASLDTELTKAEKDLLWAESVRRSEAYT